MNEHVNPVDVKCPVDWNRVPEWANWVAVESNGEVYCYACEPKWVPDFNVWATDLIYNNEHRNKSFLKLIVTEYDATFIPPDASICLWERDK